MFLGLTYCLIRKLNEKDGLKKTTAAGGLVQRSAGSRSAGFTCCFFCIPSLLAGLVNASFRKTPALLG